jgi:hypothetical protein
MVEREPGHRMVSIVYVDGEPTIGEPNGEVLTEIQAEAEIQAFTEAGAA